ncbi:MAG: phosphoglycerate dehydrogenase [Dehalococcoidia bacterium]|nr:phosphoglycerate dehydrogenase [Dehalococcoidia bacterium]
MARVLVSDKVDRAGVDLLSAAGHEVDLRPGMAPGELASVIGGYEALVIRSETQVTADLLAQADRLQVVGRAGVGVDNVDLDAATQRGIVVVNAPTGNTVAAAEHALALMLALMRHVPQAHASMREGKWERAKFLGAQLGGKTLGVVGLGKVGSEVARRAKAFQMEVLGYDPYVPHEFARNLGAELVDMDALLTRSDVITIHTPLTAATRQLIGAEQMPKLKDGVRIVNAARGGLVDEALLDQAIRDGKVAGAALDVFVSEPPAPDSPLLANPKVIVTPHLGASTEEAQAQVAVEVAEEVLAVLSGGAARYTVNVPAVPAEVREALGPYIPVADTMGRIAIQLAEGQLQSVALRVSGRIAQFDTSLLAAAALAGILGATSDERVNLVNAPHLAEEHGLRIEEHKSQEADDEYSNMVGIEVRASRGAVFVGGSVVGGSVHLLRLDDFYVDLQPSTPYMLFTTHRDQPGMIGKVGTISGNHDLNIGFMEVGRVGPRGEATMIVGYDEPLTDEVVAEISAIEGIGSVRLVTL